MNNPELEEASMTKVTVEPMTKVTVEHQGEAQPSIFRKGNLIITSVGVVVLVTAYASPSDGTFSGVKLCPSIGKASDNFWTENCKQFHGTVTLESPQ